MALGHRTAGRTRFDVALHPDIARELRAHAKRLGYPTVTAFIRVLVRNELRAPRTPRARAILGGTPREISLRKPR